MPEKNKLNIRTTVKIPSNSITKYYMKHGVALGRIPALIRRELDRRRGKGQRGKDSGVADAIRERGK